MAEQTKTERIAAQAAAVTARRRPGDRAQPAAEATIAPPVPEQSDRFTERPVAVRTEKGQVVGRAYRRQPYFVTLAKLPADPRTPKGLRLITADQLRAMRFYRSAWEATQASETRCALDFSVRGYGGNGPAVPARLWEDGRLRDCESRLRGYVLDTIRGVVLCDLSFAGVAMGRWGSRERQRVIIGKGKEKPRIVNEIVPRSSAHAALVRDEFLFGVRVLSESVGTHLAIG